MKQTINFATESKIGSYESTDQTSAFSTEDMEYPLVFDTPEHKAIFENGLSPSSKNLIIPMEFHNTFDEVNLAVEKYGQFIEEKSPQENAEFLSSISEDNQGYVDYSAMNQRKMIPDIICNNGFELEGDSTPNAFTNKPCLHKEKSDCYAQTAVQQELNSSTNTKTISMTLNSNKNFTLSHKLTSHELSKMIIRSIPMFICEEQIYIRKNNYYQRKSHTEIQRTVKSWLEKNNIPDVKPMQINEIISLIFMEESLVKHADSLNKYYIAFQNGVLNIFDGILYSHNPQYLITYLIECNYASNQTACPCFNKFLHNVTGGDKILEKRIWQMLGYLLSPDTGGKAIFLLQGISNSGKSVLSELIKSLFSSEAVMPLDVHKLGSRFSASNLVGKALCISGDMTAEPLNSNSTSKLKQFSGNDFISCDVKHSAMVSFYGRAKFVLVTNHPLLTRERDDAFVERIITIPFNFTTPPEDRDRYLIDKLKAERDAIATIATQYYFDLVSKNYKFDGEYIMNSASGIILNPSNDNDIPSNVFKFIHRFFEMAKNDGVFTEDAHQLYMSEYGYIDKKHFSTHFSNISNQLFGATKDRQRRTPVDNAISYVSGIRFKGGDKN